MHSVRLGVTYYSQATNRSAGTGIGLSQGALPASHWSPVNHILLPAAWLRTFFIAVRVRVNE